MDRVDAVVPWVARLAWIATALSGGAIDAAVDGRSDAVRWVAAVGGWALFGGVLLALLIPSVWSLTTVRLLAPLAIAVAVVTAVAGATALDVAVLAGAALLANAAIFTPEFGRWMVQGSAYGDERRFPLRVPAAAGAAAIVSWLLWAPLVVGAALVTAAGVLAVGIPLVVLALGATWFLLPRWHRISRRWFVLVPAGIVVHDPVVLADTLMVPRRQVAGLALALAGTEAADLTGPASGHAVEVTTAESVRTVFAFTPREPNGRAIHMTAFLVAPSRPGRMLAEARERSLPVG